MIAMKKQKFRFSLAELEQLDDELNGRKDEYGNIVEPGLLDSVINLKLKFLLTSINTTVDQYRGKIVEYRNKLIYKLGTMNDKKIPEIPMFTYEVVDGLTQQVPHPTFKKYEEQYAKYLTKVIDIESYPIDLDLLQNVVRRERFPKLFKYLEQQYEGAEKKEE
jgi:hypothetical protein